MKYEVDVGSAVEDVGGIVDVVEGEAVVEIGSFIQMGAPTSPGSSHLEYARVKICNMHHSCFLFYFPTS